MTRSQTARRRPPRHVPPPSKRPNLVLPIAAAVAVLIVIIAVVVSNGNKTPKTDPALQQTRPVTVSGAQFAGLPESGVDPAVGRPAPELTGAAFDGTPVRIAADGKAKVLVFFAHWCGYCQKEVPVLQRRIDAGLPADVAVYGVSTGARKDRPNYPPSDWLSREDWTPATLADDEAGAAAAAFGLTGTPFYVAIDATGKVRARAAGAIGVERFDELLAIARQPG